MVVTNFLDVDVKKTRRQRRVRINTTRTNLKRTRNDQMSMAAMIVPTNLTRRRNKNIRKTNTNFLQHQTKYN